MKYYVVSEDELTELVDTQHRFGLDAKAQAEAACRAREVPKNALKFYCAVVNKEGKYLQQWYEEIKR